MNDTNLQELYDEVVDQLRNHMHREDSVELAQVKHEEFCEKMLEAVPGIDDVSVFLKDVVIAFIGTFEFRDEGIVKMLLEGTDAGQLELLRSAKAVGVSSKAIVAWKHVAARDPEAAATIIAVAYRIYKGKVIEKILRLETELQRQTRKVNQQTSETI